jgi:hypothetical protein
MYSQRRGTAQKWRSKRSFHQSTSVPLFHKRSFSASN